MHAPFLSMSGISKAFPGVVALDRAELQADSGMVTALMGANGAGKSTLMNILGGIVLRDAGEITVGGNAATWRTPIESLAAGIAFVQQELNSLPTMTIAENIFIDAFPSRFGAIDFAQCNQRSEALLKRLGSDLDPRAIVGELSIGDRQLVEIARALRRDPKLLIFDEPTSSLSERERRRLFDVIGALKADGVAIIYITHFIDEIFQVSDQVTVMRNGRTVFHGATSSITEQEIVHHMLGGRENESQLEPNRPSNPPELLRVEGLRRGNVLNGISFNLKAGEVVGVWGLLGSGRTELLRALVGLDAIEAGTVTYTETGLAPITTPEGLSHRAGFVTEDRRGEGLFLPMTAGDNIVMPSLGAVSHLGIVRRRAQRKAALDMIERLGIKVSSQDQRVATLSGGNQQKVVFARWLATAPRMLLLDEPTRGLDVSAKTEILKLTSQLADAGTAVLLVSSELEELTRVCDRYLVMVRGRIVSELPGVATHNELLDALSNFGRESEAA
jgi:ABC-type sugar transport system ATPase subunit